MTIRCLLVSSKLWLKMLFAMCNITNGGWTPKSLFPLQTVLYILQLVQTKPREANSYADSFTFSFCQHTINIVHGINISTHKMLRIFIIIQQTSSSYRLCAQRIVAIPANILESCFANVLMDPMASSMHDIPLLIHFFAEAGPTPYTPVNIYKITEKLYKLQKCKTKCNSEIIKTFNSYWTFHCVTLS